MLGILCGLEVEAALAREVDGACVACAAARPQQARWAARELVGQGAKRLLSFGLAGGLEAGLPAGTIIIGTAVHSVDAQWPCDEKWVDELRRLLPTAHCGPVWGSEVIVARAQDKRALYEKTRSLATDMESHALAQIATEAKVPFAVLRVVADTDVMDVPKAALVPLRPDGRVDLGKVLLCLLRHPTQLLELIALGLRTRKAMKILRKIRTAL